MSPKPSENPTPGIRSFLLHNLDLLWRSYFRLSIGLPTSQFLPRRIEYDQRGDAPRARDVFDLDLGHLGARQVCDRLRPVPWIASGLASYSMCTTLRWRRILIRGGREAYAAYLPLASFRPRLTPKYRKPVY